MLSLFNPIIFIVALMPMQQNSHKQMEMMKLKITIGEHKATAIFYDNPASRDLADMLPLTLKMEDYAGTEKIANLARKLATKDSPAGFDPSIGDLTYYAPWGNLALFYKDFGYANGLVSLGKITSGMEHFQVRGSLDMTIESDE